jgi:hypothetical protein
MIPGGAASFCEKVEQYIVEYNSVMPTSPEKYLVVGRRLLPYIVERCSLLGWNYESACAWKLGRLPHARRLGAQEFGLPYS